MTYRLLKMLWRFCFQNICADLLPFFTLFSPHCCLFVTRSAYFCTSLTESQHEIKEILSDRRLVGHTFGIGTFAGGRGYKLLETCQLRPVNTQWGHY